MRKLSDKQIAAMTHDEACNWLSQAVYETCLLFERLEGERKITGNGHHAAQAIAEHASKELSRRWDWEVDQKCQAKEAMDHLRSKHPEINNL